MFPVFSLFRKKTTPVDGTFSMLATDMHSHLVPGIDDGAKDLQNSLELIKRLSQLGFKRIITTPHVRPEYFPNTRETILSGFETLKAALSANGSEIELGVAAEYFVDFEFMEYLEKEKLLTFSGGKVLIETSTIAAPPNFQDIIFQLRLSGYLPVLAHPERYLHMDLKTFQKLKELGCQFQVNLMSLAGHYGSKVKKHADLLIQNQLVDYFGTDCHNTQHTQVLAEIANDAKLVRKILDCQPQNSDLGLT
ncbi:MAG: hypothetical protein D6816_06390 [Bacteroidetes bacterium]|nr:MAG: hypothetical protein D6816_06390 [Bacteroidota bacterium]